MKRFSQSSLNRSPWSREAIALVAQARVSSGNKFEQLVERLQRNSRRRKQGCWRFVIQYALKNAVSHLRWTEEEMTMFREELLRRSIKEIAQSLSGPQKLYRACSYATILA